MEEISIAQRVSPSDDPCASSAKMQHFGQSVNAGPELKTILQGIVNRGITSHSDIRNHLQKNYPEYSMGYVLCLVFISETASAQTKIFASASTLRKYMKKLEIITVRKGNWPGSTEEAIQHVTEEMAADPSRNRGPDYINERLRKKGIHMPV